MTVEQAIAELRSDIALYETEICKPGDGSPDGDLMEALEMAIAALEHENKWISVNDALPTETGHYLVAVCEPIGEDGETTSFVLNAWYNAETFPYSEDIGWTLLNEFYEFTTRIRERITHWMPLPEPPEVEET